MQQKTKIEKQRKRAGLSRKDVAERLDVSVTAVGKWETGEALPRAAKLPELASLLKCSVNDLL